MKILWLVNLPLPEASALMKEEPYPYGGWLINAAKELSLQPDLKLTIVFPRKHSKKIEKLQGEKIEYYTFPRMTKNKVYENVKSAHFQEILTYVKPDLVHIYGTEFTHSLAMVNTCIDFGIETVISIQGLVSKVAQHILANLPLNAIYGFTFRNLILKDNIIGQKKRFEIKGENEVLALKKTKYVLGRTTWDYASVTQINPNVQYYNLNETLRGEFYKYSWNYENCTPQSIFLSQSQDSYKGLHYMLDALPIIHEKFPKAKIYIAGTDITSTTTLKKRLLQTQYGKYIKSKIDSLNIESSVIFTGPLNEVDMCKRFLSSNVFVCPSSIENSPNSLGEAMIMGVPSVASYVGGIPDMLEHNKEGYLYQQDAPYMLAYYICKIFEDKDKTSQLSANARTRAINTHSIKNNKEKLVNIYDDILQQSATYTKQI